MRRCPGSSESRPAAARATSPPPEQPSQADDGRCGPSPAASEDAVPTEATGHDGSLRVVGVGVAGAGAGAELRNPVIDIDGPLEFDMRHRAIFVDVAPGAIGPERGEFPGDGLAIRGVTAVAADPGPMIHISR